MKKYVITVRDVITGDVLYTKRVSVTRISKKQLEAKANEIAMRIIKDEDRPAKGIVLG
jgi:hypothetical protein